jgi:hypothetical protein
MDLGVGRIAGAGVGGRGGENCSDDLGAVGLVGLRASVSPQVSGFGVAGRGGVRGRTC